MKIYKVEIERLSFDMGVFQGYDLIGYYADKSKAEKVAKETYEKRCPITEGETKVTEIKVE